MQTQPSKNPEPKSKTIVINNREALIMGQMPYRDKDKQGRIVAGEIVKIVPGVNLVDTETLKKLRENKLFDSFFSTKIARTPAPEQNPEKVGHYILVEVKQVPERNSLREIPANECADLVKETFSVSLLEAWIKAEDRHEVRASIQNQLDTIKTAGVPAGA